MGRNELPRFAEAPPSAGTPPVFWKFPSRSPIRKRNSDDDEYPPSVISSFLQRALPREQQFQQGPAIPSPRMLPSDPITINKTDVVNELMIHKEFCMPWIAPGVEVTNLPSFDDVTNYGVKEETQYELWNLEAQALVDDVIQKEPLRFQGSSDLAVDSKESYALLAIVADQLMQCLHIYNHDSETLLAKHHEPLCDKLELQKCKTLLGYLSEKGGVLKDNTAEDSDRNSEDDAFIDDSDADLEDDLEDDFGETLGTGNFAGNLDDFFNFVDYCTSVLARNLCSAVDGKYVQVYILAQMARIRTKVKVVSANPRKYARISLNKAAEGTKPLNPVEPQDTQEGNPDMSRIFQRFGIRPHGAETGQLEEESKKNELRITYFEKCNTYRRTLTRMLGEIVGHLRGNNKLTQTFPTFYEISAVVYQTGFESLCTLVSQDEGNGFTGTSDAVTVNYCHNAAYMLNQTLMHLYKTGKLTPSSARVNPPSAGPDVPVDGSSIGTIIYWEYTTGSEPASLVANSTSNLGSGFVPSPKRSFVSVNTMSDVITMVVPLLLMNAAHGRFATQFFNLVSCKSFLSGPFDGKSSKSGAGSHQHRHFRTRIYGKYQAFFSLSTTAYCEDQQSRPEGAPISLFNAPMRRNNLHKGEKIGMMRLRRANTQYLGRSTPDNQDLRGPASTAVHVDEDTLRRRIEVHQQELTRYGAQMRSWVSEEKGVMVQCRTYVLAWCMFAAVVVGGGIACGATVGEKIKGVDPFNITTYTWVLAGFIILIVKCVRVHDWPWNDFLHGRVLCKNVSELSSVTGINEQLIIAKLLQDESLSCMTTRGPFNAVFRKQSNDGFSIDRPISMWTMLLSGLIMVEVESIGGRSLVCLDLRRGSVIEEIRSVENSQNDKKECIHSRDLPSDEEWARKGDRNMNKLVLVKGKTQWVRVLGIYSNKDAMFI